MNIGNPKEAGPLREKLKFKVKVPNLGKAIAILLMGIVLDILDYLSMFVMSPGTTGTTILVFSTFSDLYLLFLGPILDYIAVMLTLFWFGWEKHKVAVLIMMSELLFIIGLLAPMTLIGAIKLVFDVKKEAEITVGE